MITEKLVAEMSAKIGKLNGKVLMAHRTNHHTSDSCIKAAIMTNSCARSVKVCHVLAVLPWMVKCLRKAAVV